jgi:hypothetical protein
LDPDFANHFYELPQEFGAADVFGAPFPIAGSTTRRSITNAMAL